MSDKLDNDEELQWGRSNEGSAPEREVAPVSPRRPDRSRSSSAPGRRSTAREQAERARVDQVTLLLWGSPLQGKSYYLWALGRLLRDTTKGGFRFSKLLDSFQSFWSTLDEQRRDVSGKIALTALKSGSNEVEGGLLRLFQVWRPGIRGLLSKVRIEVVTKDLPGESIDHADGSLRKSDEQVAGEAVTGEARALAKDGRICFVVVRGDEICRSGPEGWKNTRNAQTASDRIRQRLSLLGEGRGRTAVVLTACDAIGDSDWRRRLGFGGDGVAVGDALARRSEARKYLCAQDPLIRESLEQYPDIQVFATAAYRASSQGDGDAGPVGVDEPLYVEEPLVWVLEHEFEVRERAMRRHWARRMLAAVATFSLLAAAGSHLVTAPLANAVDDRRAPTDAIAPAISSLPEWLLRFDRPRALAGLHAEAVGHARANRAANVESALRMLAQLDPQGYHFTRAQIEVFNSALQRGQAADSSEDAGGSRAAARIVEQQLVDSTGRLDRYGESTMQLRRILLLARTSRDPRDEATNSILDGLSANRTFAVQHGEQVGTALFAQWAQSPPKTVEQLGVLLETLSRLRGLLTRESWLALMGRLAPQLSDAALRCAATEDVEPMRALIGWPADDRAVQSELQRVLTMRCAGILAADAASGSAARDALANLYCANADVAASLESLHLHVVDALVRRRDEQGLRRLRPVALSAPGEAHLRLAAADWSSLQANVALDPRAAVVALAATYRDAIASVAPTTALAEIKRFAFVAETCARRHPRCAETVQGELSAMAAALAMRDGVLETIAPPDAEWVADRMTMGSTPQDIDRIETVARAVVARAGKIPPATVAVIVAEFVSFLRSVASTVPVERMREFDGLARNLVAPVVSGAVGSDATALVQVVGCWRAIDASAPERTRLDEMSASIINTILATPAWSDNACDAIAWVLSEHSDPKSFLAKVDQPQKLIDALGAFVIAAFGRSKAEAAARAIVSIHVAQPAAAREAVREALRVAAEGGVDAGATEATVWADCARSLAARPAVRADYLAVVVDGLARLLDGPASSSTSRSAQLAGVLVEVVRGEDDLVSKMPTGLRRELVAQDLAQTLQLAAARQAETGVARVVAALRWLAVDRVQFTDAVARSPVAFDSTLAGLLDMRDIVGATPGAASDAIGFLVEELLRRGGKVESAATLLGALNRLVQKPIAGKPASVALAELLDQQCQAAAARGDLAALLDRWRLAAACARSELSPKALWPKVDGDALRQLAQASRMRAEDGWTVRQAATAIDTAFRTESLDPSAVAEWFIGLAVQTAALLLGLGDVASVQELADANVSPMGIQAASESQVRFTCELLGVTLQQFADANVDLAFRGRVELVVAKIMSVAARSTAVGGVTLAVATALPPEADVRFAAALAAQVSAGRGDGSGVIARAMAIACANQGARGAVQFGPAFDVAVAAVGSDSGWAETIGQMRAARGWPEARHRLLSEAVLRALRDDLAAGKPSTTLDTRLADVRKLIGAYDGFASRAGVTGWSARIQESLEPDVAALLAGQPAARWGDIGRAFEGLPILGGHVVVAQAAAALATGQWAIARNWIEKVGDANVAARMRSFLANAESMVPIPAVGGGTAYLSPTEVTVQQYAEFVAAMQADPQQLKALAQAVGWSIAPSAALAAIRPGDTAPELRQDDMPVHRVSWWGARTYCAWRGLELPTVEVLRSAWGKRAYPWGDEWDAGATVTLERFPGRDAIKLMAVGAGPDLSADGVRHLHGNVSELTADSTSLGEVHKFGCSAWENGKGVDRGNVTHVDSRSSARDRKEGGVGFRVMLTPPKSWKASKG